MLSAFRFAFEREKEFLLEPQFFVEEKRVRKREPRVLAPFKQFRDPRINAANKILKIEQKPKMIRALNAF